MLKRKQAPNPNNSTPLKARSLKRVKANNSALTREYVSLLGHDGVFNNKVGVHQPSLDMVD